MNSKNDILNRIKAHPVPEVERPAMDFEPMTFEDKIRHFMEVAQLVGCDVFLLEKGGDINETIRKQYPDAKVIASDLPGIACATLNPDALTDPRELNGTDVGVIRGEFGVIENGAVWIRQSTRYKALYFISESLVIVLDRHQIVNNMHEAYRHPYFNDFGYGCFIAGPSKTADIEQALVIGAHGPKAVTIILTD
ncbi:LutC/YkgG family protein [Gabonibacter massiliensis]|uniref:LutC/YkgG family protein n=1 Tax=Gabonibacter massiliensis TaxID=1720195 RepID=UPI00073ED29E|nr:LUD domain-containing protein [Gabonibacter massiliensis]